MNDLKKSLEEIARNIQIDHSAVEPEVEPCDVCGTLGMVAVDVPPSHPYYKKLIPCPACKKGQAEQRRILENRIKATELPAIYRDANLGHWWQDLGSEEFREGKRLAYLTALEFVNAPDNMISSHAVAQRVLRLMADRSPRWIKKILDARDIVRSGFALYGPVGTGKTWLAAAVMNALVEQGKLVLYMRAQDIIQSLTATWRNSTADETEDTVLERYKTAPFLFIDDMNLELRGESLLPHQKDYMESIVRHRHNHQLHTFITCNISIEQFREQWGSRTSDVLEADLQWIKMGGAKLRQTRQTWEEEL